MVTFWCNFRRKHKKGTTEETAKKRTRRTVKFDRAIQGATLEQILQKRNQSQDVRKAQREQLIRLVASNVSPLGSVFIMLTRFNRL